MPPSDEADPRRPGSAAPHRMRAELLHQPFFSALSTLGGHEGGREWRAVVAGLVTLRLADRRMASADDWGGVSQELASQGQSEAGVPACVIEAARVAASAVDREDMVAWPLRALVHSAGAGAASDVLYRLLAYANALHADSRWPLAADVYRTLLRFADSPRVDGPAAPQPFVPHVYDRLGRSLRMMGALDEARAAYAAGRAAARLLRDENGERLIRISEAKILLHLGNLPAAAAALDAIIREANAAGVVPLADWVIAAKQAHESEAALHDTFNVVASAQHDRAAVATLQHDLNFAAEQYFAAWRAYRDPIGRERVWVDLALNFAEMGLRDVAREAFLVLLANAQRREVRHIAATNLLELAVVEGREDLFETYRRMLHQATMDGTLPAELTAKFALYEGRGEARFGRLDRAVAAFERALSLAIVHRVHEVTIRSDEALAEIRAGRPVDPLHVAPETIPITPSVERIARVVRRAGRRAGTPR